MGMIVFKRAQNINISDSKQRKRVLAGGGGKKNKRIKRYFVVVAVENTSSEMASQIQRAERMIVGSLLSDAATMGLHWIYNQNDIAEKVLTRGGSPAFFNPPACPFYTYEAGSLSPYGDEIVPFLRSMATEGEFVPQSAATASYEFFKTYTGRLNHPSKHFVESWDAGKGWEDCACVDHQAQGIIKTPLLVARYAGSAELDLKIKSAVDVLQVSELSISASKLSAKILERILLTGCEREPRND